MVNHPHRSQWAWMSKGIYEHPAKHQAGTYGNIAKSNVGIYILRVGGSYMSCPQGWAAGIEKAETEKKYPHCGGKI